MLVWEEFACFVYWKRMLREVRVKCTFALSFLVPTTPNPALSCFTPYLMFIVYALSLLQLCFPPNIVLYSLFQHLTNSFVNIICNTHIACCECLHCPLTHSVWTGSTYCYDMSKDYCSSMLRNGRPYSYCSHIGLKTRLQMQTISANKVYFPSSSIHYLPNN